jgi:hypothetical protein
MIYQKYNFIDSFSNASAIGSSRGRLVVAELGKLIKNQPEEVGLALSDAGIKVPKNATKKQLIKLVLDNRNNASMITNLSLLIYASASIDMGYNFFGKNRDNSSSEDKEGMFKKLGNWFRERKDRRAERKAGRESGEKTSLWQKVGGFVKNNKDEISLVGGSLADALANRRASSTTLTSNSGSVAQDILRNDNQQKAGFFQKNQTAIIVGGVLLGVAFIYWKSRGK